MGKIGQIASVILLALLTAYRRLLSPFLPASCRYFPSCSEYAIDAVQCHGPWRGAWLAARRLLRCHPWGDSGFDPVPPKEACGSSVCSACADPLSDPPDQPSR